MKNPLHFNVAYLILLFGLLMQGTLFSQPYFTLGTSWNIYLGYSPPCKSFTPIIQNGEPYNFYTQEEYNQLSYEWTLNRPLSSGETMDITTVGAGFLWPVSPPVMHYYGTVSEATVCLLNSAQLCLTVTDWNGNSTTECTWIYVEDVRCGTGNGDLDKILLCHYTGSGYEDKCVSVSAVPAHLEHGDHLGTCVESAQYASGNIAEDPAAEPAAISTITFPSLFPADIIDPAPERPTILIFPNPVHDILHVSVPEVEKGSVAIEVMDLNGRVMDMAEQKEYSGDLVEQFDVRYYASGTYLVRITSGHAVTIEKVIIAH